MNVCFVCTGNINRSIVAEILAKDAWPGMEVSSAALSSKAGGVLMAPKMRRVLKGLGIVFDEDRRSQQLMDEMVEQADLVLYMAPVHKRKLLQRWPQYAVKFQPASPWGTVPDPHFCTGTATHVAVIQELEKAIHWWAPKLGVF